MKKEGVISPVKESVSTEAPDWVHHDNTAYFFLDNKTWNNDMVNIGVVSSAEFEDKQIFDVGIDHGSRPENGKFVYAIAPSISLEETKSISLPVQIIENTSDIQAIYNTETSTFYVSFFEPGEVDLPNDISLASSEPCVIIMEAKDNMLMFSVANPKGESDDIEAINLSVNRNLAGEGAVFDKKMNTTAIRIPLPRKTYSGKNVTISFTLR